jgi:hypothetical protein
MLYISDSQYVTIWEVEDKGSYSLVKMSTSRKNKKTGEYLNSNWSFVRFVGDAHTKASELKRQDRIVLKGAGISQEPYKDANGNKAYPKNPQFVVFNFEYPEAKSNDRDMDNPPVVSDDEELPF